MLLGVIFISYFLVYFIEEKIVWKVNEFGVIFVPWLQVGGFERNFVEDAHSNAYANIF
jgi:hypothetical protein